MAMTPREIDPQRIAQFLEHVEMFRGLEADSRLRIAEAAGYFDYAQGDEVIVQGAPGDALFILAKGKVEVIVNDASMGVEQRVATLGPGEFFGEMALLLEGPRTATVRAMQPTACVVLSREAFYRLFEHLPQVASNVCKYLAMRLQTQNRLASHRFVRLADFPFNAEVYGSIPQATLERHQIVPVEAEGDKLTIVTTRPHDPGALEAIKAAAPGMKLQVFACAEEDYRQYAASTIRAAIGRPLASPSGSRVTQQYRAADVSILEPEARVKRSTGDIPGDQIVKLVNEIVTDALNRGASDIHIEPSDTYCRVRFRVDGRLVAFREDLPSRFHAPLASRIKILADMDIAERRRPQDGRIGLKVGEKSFDLRVNILPTLWGEKVVMRVLDAEKSLVPLDQLILSEPLAAVVRKAIYRPTGGVFVVGPTGSGKTTTLYSAINERKQQSNDLNIVTLEDPIEYTLGGVNQTQVHDEVGMSFASALRALLRQDPNVIMIGEMRDLETARIALEAALTGHLVLSTLHTEGAVEAVTRLVEMGCPSFLVSTAVDVVIAQRLVRRACRSCKTPHAYNDVVRHNLDRAGVLPMAESETLSKGAGCEACSRTGYQSRVGVYEVLRNNDTLREAIGLGEQETSLKKIAAEARSITTFRQYAGFLLRAGHTTPSEVLRLFHTD